MLIYHWIKHELSIKNTYIWSLFLIINFGVTCNHSKKHISLSVLNPSISAWRSVSYHFKKTTSPVSGNVTNHTETVLRSCCLQQAAATKMVLQGWSKAPSVKREIIALLLTPRDSCHRVLLRSELWKREAFRRTERQKSAGGTSARAVIFVGEKKVGIFGTH